MAVQAALDGSGEPLADGAIARRLGTVVVVDPFVALR
jgi:hypothetical protein